MYKRGFTLIELLVVIAIIGILSSVVLVALRQARLKSYNGRVKAQLDQFRTSAELYYQGHLIPSGTYAGQNTYNFNNSDITGNCTAGSSAFRDTESGGDRLTNYQNYPGLSSQSDIACWSPLSGATYAITVKLPLPEVSNGVTYNYWCLDSRGVLKGRTNPLTSVAQNCDS